MKRCIKLSAAVWLMTVAAGCNSFIDVVPDNVATLEYAFRMRTTAEKYLATCYSFIPDLGGTSGNVATFGSDELWLNTGINSNATRIARGEQNKNSPYHDYWNGSGSGTPLWTAISQCNVFLENIGSVPDMEELEKKQWIAEVKTLKAFYHFYLLRMYGPIPIMRENLPISASGEEVRVFRQPVDDVFEYIVELLDEASVDLRPEVLDETSELGRMTLPIAKGLKARVLVFAASPLFNGNPDYIGFVGKDGVKLFNETFSIEKWERAATAAKEAIDVAHEMGYGPFQFEPGIQQRNISDTTITQLNYRSVITERWNSEIIWALTNSTTRNIQRYSTPRALDASMIGFQEPRGYSSVPMKIASLFYTHNGVPIEEDHTWSYNDRYELRVGTAKERYSIKEGYTTAEFNFDRESRFYGGLGFDGGIWYGQGKYDDDDTYWYEGKLGQFGGKTGISWHSVTGYYPKRHNHYTNTTINRNTWNTIDYPWPMLRLSDLYLLYAEAMNEAYGPSDEVYQYLNIIRAKADLPTVQSAWENFSRNPKKYTTQEGLRAIIQQERGIEMAFEGHRFWDIRRWKTAPEEAAKPITGWDVDQETNEGYYRERFIFRQEFGLKDYFWPIRESDLIVNKNLVQNPGW
ncbi:RagB/SusD family nutrient uptake outer membrane protein [Parapedobacter sp. 10938]|uniref:RagB/SusD family nutrient uptake outer membrane protein n=1 Tax=Parapedobacter flavus TaxID=3110225 RepID=UPI002DBDA320|nr:RagB/SusD family nutrient uptake outer membrane protein [Parapedobacter sp. 10938]MEC3880441.1 RagB/SusD family nutrient uptake outer membrane protein [Parapedobacter sp. 10938]